MSTNNQPAIDAIVPLTSSGQVVSTRTTTVQRFLRTGIQLIAGGLLTTLIDLVVQDVSPGAVPYILAVSTLVVTGAQNYAEEQGWVPIILKRPSVGRP